MTFVKANSWDPDWHRLSVCPDLDTNDLTLWQCSWKNTRKKLILKTNSQQITNITNINK